MDSSISKIEENFLSPWIEKIDIDGEIYQKTEKFLFFYKIKKNESPEYKFCFQLVFDSFYSLKQGNLACYWDYKPEYKNYLSTEYFKTLCTTIKQENPIYKPTRKPIIIVFDKEERGAYIYFQKQWNTYVKLFYKIKDFMNKEPTTFVARQKTIDNDLCLLEVEYKKTLNPEQKIAIKNSIQNPFNIITGGPGTGKTTVVSFILELYFKYNPLAKTILLAPTGRASSRLKESLENHIINPLLREKLKNQSLEVKTIDSFIARTESFINSDIEKEIYIHLELDCIIIDEISMVSPALFEKLIYWISPNTKIILLGDPYQLPSVQEGFLLGYFLNSSYIKNYCIYELKTLMRADNNKLSDMIYTIQSHMKELLPIKIELEKQVQNIFNKIERITLKDFEKIQNPLYKKDFLGVFWLEINNEKEKTIFDILDVYIKGYEEFYSKSPLNIIDIFTNFYQRQILTPMKKGNMGTDIMNQYCLSQVFYHKKIPYYPIVITKNEPYLNIYNGDLGLEKAFESVYFINKDLVKEYITDQIKYKDLSFSMTVHKSQGSEFNEIILFLPSYSVHKVLSEEIFYTAISRAKQRVIIIALKETLHYSLSYKIDRCNGLEL